MGMDFYPMGMWWMMMNTMMNTYYYYNGMMGMGMGMPWPNYYYGYGPMIMPGSNSLFISNNGDHNRYDITQGGIQGTNGDLQPVSWP